MNSTFRGCTSLVQAPAIPANVTNMGATFYSCTSMTQAPEIPDGVKDMNYTFYECAGLKQATELPISITALRYTFYNCTSLTQAPTIPNTVTSLEVTFYGCKELKEVPELPSSVTNMRSTFSGCSGLLQAPNIPDSVTDMNSAFRDCTSLILAPIISDKVTNMGATFYGCTSLKQVPRLPNNLQSLYYTFYNCSSLKQAPKIPESVENMDSTFRGCTSLTQAPKLPDGVVNLRYTFGNCSSLTNAPVIPDKVSNMECTFRNCTGLLSAPVIPPNVTNLDNAFSYATSLTGDVYIPGRITSINNIFDCTEKPIKMIYSYDNTSAASCSAPKNVTKVVDIALPEIISIAENDIFNITINASDDSVIARYAVTVSPIPPERGWQTSNSFSNLTVGKYYAWAIDGVGNISAGKEVIIFDKNIFPQIKAVPAGTYINYTWLPVENCVNYEIELDGKVIKTGLVTSYTHKGLKPSTQHTYRIRAICVLGTSNWSLLQTIHTTDGKITTVPQNIVSRAGNTTITLTWESVDEAEGYDITSILPDGTMGTIMDNGSLTTCELRGLSPNSAYKYKIRGKNSAGEGPWSNELEVATYLLDTPQNIILLKSDTSIKFTWDEVLNADAYELKYYEIAHTNGVTGSAINIQIPDNTSFSANVTGTTITITELTPCTEYKYSIRAKSSQGFSSWREEKSTFTLPQKPDTPKDVNAIVSESKITVSWKELLDVSVVGYDVELDGVILENDTENIYIHEGLEPYSIHTYRVRARNDLVEGEWSLLNSIRTLPARPTEPKEIAIKSTQTGAVLSWKAEPGAEG